ncbi:Down syndrome cell adhesion molecule-like protein 1 [Nymphon striatum]|nr:Down syndrome cell adhesion molecule-like protein 1 [Nymphon striatum]
MSSRYSTNTTEMPLDVYNGKLIIHSVKERDYGDYTCRAWNEIDDTRTIIRLVKKGPPDTPSALQMVNVSFDEVTLKWIEEFNGGHSNTEFVVRYAIPHNGKTLIYDCRRSNPCIVTGLIPQTLYTFSVKAVNPAGESEYSDFLSVHTKVNLKSIPEPSEVYFNKDKSEVHFRVPVDSSLKLFAKIEVLTGSWKVAKETEPLQSNYMRVKLEEAQINDVRVKLCLVHTRKMCGHGQISKTGEQVSPKSDNMPLIYMILIPGVAVLIVIIIVVAICCCRRRGKKSKKDYEMDNQDSRPKAVTGPYYPDTITKSDDHDGDNLKNGIYATNLSGHPGLPLPNGQLSNGGLHYTDSSHLVSTNSSDNQSDLWIKANGSGEIPNGSYQQYDPASGFMYPEDYHPLNDDLMNQRNRDPYSPPYYDVSGLPDPYQNDDEDKNPQQMSFDESLESGYSTPNSRNRRVIREIIV